MLTSATTEQSLHRHFLFLSVWAFLSRATLDMSQAGRKWHDWKKSSSQYAHEKKKTLIQFATRSAIANKDKAQPQFANGLGNKPMSMLISQSDSSHCVRLICWLLFKSIRSWMPQNIFAVNNSLFRGITGYRDSQRQLADRIAIARLQKSGQQQPFRLKTAKFVMKPRFLGA